jgi:exopolysaccharide production protein ExoQ
LLASIGAVGLALFLVTVIDFYRMALKNLGDKYSKIMTTLVTFVIFHGVTETTILYSTNLLWFVYMCCFVRMSLINQMNTKPSAWQRLWGTR